MVFPFKLKAACRHTALAAFLFALLTLLNACFMPNVEFPPDPTATTTHTPTPRPTRWPTVTPTPPSSVDEQAACVVPELQFDQHISADGSFTATQWEASGPMVCRMSQRCAKSALTGNINPLIVFKQEEEPPYAEEDIFVHPAMLKPLDNLTKLVQAEWGGTVQLRITDSYDSLLEHDLNQDDPNLKYSLHFEGRAVDLTTWPIDLNLYPRLCSLASCAGFTWVHNEGDHCHASINAESLCSRCSE